MNWARFVRQRVGIIAMLRRSPILIMTCAAVACLSTVSPDDGPGNTVASQGIVKGFVRDTAGSGVANAVVCATAVFTASGTPAIAVGYGTTSGAGAYQASINLAFSANARAALTVAATPASATGLEPAYRSGFTVLITTALPPAETTHVDLVVVSGTPSRSVLCVSGP
jgi:hypothetical protein